MKVYDQQYGNGEYGNGSANPKSRTGETAVYGTVARALHWLVFALIAAQFAIAWTMPHIRTTTPQEGLVDWHLSLGAVIMLVVIARLVWRAINPVPLEHTMKAWERLLAGAAHYALYALLIVLPVLGWASAGYFGYTVHLFGVIDLPGLAAKGTEWAHEAGDIHAVLANVLLGLVGLHVVGAFYHYAIVRDRVMQRMLPGI